MEGEDIVFIENVSYHTSTSTLSECSSLAGSHGDAVRLPDTQSNMNVGRHPTEARSEMREPGEVTEHDVEALDSISENGFPSIRRLPVHAKPGLPGLENEHPPLSLSSPPPPPPPPPPGMPPFPNMTGMAPPGSLPLPPPPPPPEPSPGVFVPSCSPPVEVNTPTQFIHEQYSSESISDFASHVIHIGPFRRNVLMTRHPAHAADYKEFEWLLKHGSSEIWYEKPTKAHLRSIRTLEANRWAPDELLPLLNARPVSLETPKVWASASMTTPTDDDIFECVAGHAVDHGYAGTCHECTDTKSELLERTPLVYCLVFSTCQASDPFIHGAHFNGRQIYKLVKCGSREAAVSEAFYAAGVNGWGLAFSCVMKLGEDFEEKSGTAKKVKELWMLAEEEDNEKIVKVFY